MTLRQAKALKVGDVVYWNDPEGTCSKYIKISEVDIHGNKMVRLTDSERDGYLVCFPQELTLEKTVKIRLTLDVEYQPYGTDPIALQECLVELGIYAANNGLMIHPSDPAEVEEWNASAKIQK